MKFQSTLIILIFATWIAAKPLKKLTIEENSKRMEGCGRGGLSDSPGTWFWASKSSGPKPTYSSAIQISSRHFFTFSQTLINEDMEWRHNQSKFRIKCEDSKHVEVPIQQSLLKFIPIRCMKEKNCQKLQKVQIKNVFLLNFCDYYEDNKETLKMFPMIVEVKEDLEGDVPCLPSDWTSIKVGDTIPSYRLFTDGTIREFYVTVEDINKYVIATDFPPGPKDVGGPMVVEIDDKWTVVGYSGSWNRMKTSEDSKFHRVFQNMYWLQKGICELTGVCGQTFFEPRIDPPTTSEASTIKRTTLAPKTTEISSDTTTKSSENSPITRKTSTPKEATSSENTTEAIRKDEQPIDYQEYEEMKDNPEDVTFSDDELKENGKRKQLELFLILFVLWASISRT